MAVHSPGAGRAPAPTPRTLTPTRASAIRVVGHGPLVVVVHGVGTTSDRLERLVRPLTPHYAFALVDRPGYGRMRHRMPHGRLDRSVDELAGTIADLPEAPVAYLGISGGATLGLALGIARPGLVPTLVLHEPLVGPHAPALHDRIATAARALEQDASLGAVEAVVTRLAGPTSTPAAARVERAVRTEVPAFLGFGPTTDQLRRACAAQRIVVTLGELSDEPRQAAARVLADRGAAVIAAPGSAHVPQVEAPAAYAAVLATVLADPEVA